MAKSKAIKGSLTLEGRKSMYGYIFILPWIIGFLFFFVKPLIQTAQFSLSNLTVEPTGYKLEFVGLENYKTAFFSDANFPRYLTASIKKMLTDTPVILIFSFFAALLLKQKFIGNNAIKTVFFLPVILASGVFAKMQAQVGNLNTEDLRAAMQEGMQAIPVLQSVRMEYILIDAGLGDYVQYITGPVNNIFNIISLSSIQIFIFLAGLHSIHPSLFEACYIEGATGWESFWKITFPMISPLILVNTIYTVIDSFTAYSNTTMTYIYNAAFGLFKFGFSSAMAWIYFICIGGILSIVGLLVSKRIFYYT